MKSEELNDDSVLQNSRNLRDIFSSIHSIAKLRESSNKIVEKQLNCLCEKNQFHNDESNEDIQDTDGIYIENTPQGSRFAVCPACNPRVNCPSCNGTGHKSFLYSDSEALRPNSCSCMHLQNLVEKLNQAKIPDKYIHAEFNSFNFNHIEDENSKNKLVLNIEKIEKFCEKMNPDLKPHSHKKYFMTLFGPVGCGKTMLATAALKTLMSNYNMTGKFVDFQYLLSELRAEYDEHKTGESILNELRNTNVLVIDEFGKGRNDKEWQLEKLDDLVNYRYNAQKITFITTNYLPQSIKYQEKEIPYTRGRDLYSNEIPINETFWQQGLSERIGMRMYERILEVSEFIDFTNLPSYRKFLGRNFLAMYTY